MATVEATHDLIGMLEDATEEEAKRSASRGGGMRGSKWRSLIEAFVETGQPVKRLPATKDKTAGGVTFAAASGGLNNVLKQANEQNTPYPVKVSISRTAGYVYLTNTDLASNGSEAE